MNGTSLAKTIEAIAKANLEDLNAPDIGTAVLFACGPALCALAPMPASFFAGYEEWDKDKQDRLAKVTANAMLEAAQKIISEL
jgi:hypothetical protein